MDNVLQTPSWIAGPMMTPNPPTSSARVVPVIANDPGKGIHINFTRAPDGGPLPHVQKKPRKPSAKDLAAVAAEASFFL